MDGVHSATDPNERMGNDLTSPRKTVQLLGGGHARRTPHATAMVTVASVTRTRDARDAHMERLQDACGARRAASESDQRRAAPSATGTDAHRAIGRLPGNLSDAPSRAR
jgi:hypothetical protein